MHRRWLCLPCLTLANSLQSLINTRKCYFVLPMSYWIKTQECFYNYVCLMAADVVCSMYKISVSALQASISVDVFTVFRGDPHSHSEFYFLLCINSLNLRKILRKILCLQVLSGPAHRLYGSKKVRGRMLRCVLKCIILGIHPLKLSSVML